MMSHSVYTIGHSNYSIEHFLHLLDLHKIEAVADVRSSPYSRHNPQYNRETLQDSLKTAGIQYVFLGKELGARSEDPTCYVENQVQYDRLAQTPLFQAGIDRVLKGANQYRLALMCAEKEPLQCHRTILVARELEKRGCDIQHILAEGSLESHADAMDRLVGLLRLEGNDLFTADDDRFDLAYAKQGEKIAYVREE